MIIIIIIIIIITTTIVIIIIIILLNLEQYEPAVLVGFFIKVNLYWIEI